MAYQVPGAHRAVDAHRVVGVAEGRVAAQGREGVALQVDGVAAVVAQRVAGNRRVAGRGDADAVGQVVGDLVGGDLPAGAVGPLQAVVAAGADHAVRQRNGCAGGFDVGIAAAAAVEHLAVVQQAAAGRAGEKEAIPVARIGPRAAAVVIGVATPTIVVHRSEDDRLGARTLRHQDAVDGQPALDAAAGVWNLTTAPGWMVSVTPALTLAWPVIKYTLPLVQVTEAEIVAGTATIGKPGPVVGVGDAGGAWVGVAKAWRVSVGVGVTVGVVPLRVGGRERRCGGRRRMWVWWYRREGECWCGVALAC